MRRCVRQASSRVCPTDRSKHYSGWLETPTTPLSPMKPGSLARNTGLAVPIKKTLEASSKSRLRDCGKDSLKSPPSTFLIPSDARRPRGSSQARRMNCDQRPLLKKRNLAKGLAEYRKRVWVTRKGIHIDRMGSAWLIKRFIDPDAKFKLVPARGYRPEKGEIRFDMFEAEFTHEGDRCTFEVLIARLVPSLGALRPIAEIIHDIDLKDGKFERAEAAGIDALITGICTRSKDDDERLQRGSAIFDDLFVSFSRRNR
jgi:hypothetical protein